MYGNCAIWFLISTQGQCHEELRTTTSDADEDFHAKENLQHEEINVAISFENLTSATASKVSNRR